MTVEEPFVERRRVGTIKRALTEDDNSTLDFVRILGALVVVTAFSGIIIFLVLVIIAYYQNRSFDMFAYGTGLGAVLASVGAFMSAFGLAQKLQPRNEDGDKN